MRRPPTGKRKRKDVITWSKLLTSSEQQLIFSYLQGGLCDAINKKFINPNLVNARRMLLIYEIFLCTGLRGTELAQLRVQDTPSVLGVNMIEVYRGKYDKDRTIPVSQRIVDEIESYIKNVRPKTIPRHIKRSDISKPLFYNKRGHPYTQQFKYVNKKTGEVETRTRASTALYRKIRRLGKHAGITKRLHPHMLRHSFATNALLNGVDIYMLKELMGHSDIGVTAKYLHIVNAQLEGLGEKLDRVF